MEQKKTINAEFPDAFDYLFEPHRYKVAYGGRGGAKSWAFARALLIQASANPLRVLCARELQKSIKDSVHKLLSDQVVSLGLEHVFDVQQAAIKGRPGTPAAGSEFFFEGLRHNTMSIKSYEGVDRVWVEEAHLVSKSSWEILIPTVRKEGSEIWISFNPELREDETYQRFVVKPPADAIVRKVGWRDNPFFPTVLELERRALQERDPDAYHNVWEGHCREILEGAIFANELRAARSENRIGRVQWDPACPVDTYWDLGWADATSIWFVQPGHHEYRLIDFVQDQLKSIQYYIKELQLRKYTYRTCYLPHDADHKTLAAGGRSVAQQIRAGGIGERVYVLERIPAKGASISAARAVFPMCWFDEDKCADGLQSLRHYRYEVDPDTRAWSDKPAHDWSSHAADAFMSIGAAILPENTHRTGRKQFNGFDNISGRLKPSIDGSYKEVYAN